VSAAAAALGDDVRIVSVGNGESPLDPLDAVIVVGATSSAPAERAVPDERAKPDERAGPPWRLEQARTPLVLALALDGSAGEHVRLLGREADVVLSATTHGRVVLATVLALLRWRGR
jgi:hypothetical protein